MSVHLSVHLRFDHAEREEGGLWTHAVDARMWSVAPQAACDAPERF